MENTTPSSSAPPYPPGAGGKFRKPPISRKRPSTPYDRPPPTTANNESYESQDGGGGWLSKFVATPARRLIVSGATRILPSFFSKPESSVADEYEDDSSSDPDDEDVDAAENALTDAKHTLEIGVSSSSKNAVSSNQMDKLKGSVEHVNIQQDESKKSVDNLGVDQIENLLKGKQFSRDESMRLMDILKSRLVDDSNARGKEKATNVISVGQDKGIVLEHEMPSTSNINTRYDMETPRPRLQSNIQDEVAASPIDIAKAYMGTRVSELGINTYNNISTTRIEQQTHDIFPSKSHFLTPSSKSSTCWPGVMVQDQHNYLTPHTQRTRYGLHNFPRTPYSRTKSKLNQLQGVGKSPNTSLTAFQQSRLQTKTSSDVTDGGYGSVGPIRRVRNKFASESKSVGPTSLSSSQIPPFFSTSRSFTPVFQKKPLNSSTSNLNPADKHEQTFKQDSSPSGPQNETVRKILEHLDRHKSTPKEKAAELALASQWKQPSSSQDNNISRAFATSTGPDLQKSEVSTDSGYLNKPKDQMKTSNAEIKTSASVTGPNIKENEKGQPWSIDNKINGQDLTKKKQSQPMLKPISFKRPDPQQVVSSDNGRGFTFSFPATTASSASEPPTPSIMPSFPPPAAPQSKELIAVPTYSFGMNKTSERVVFSFPSTSSASVDDGASDIKFNFGSGKKRLSFASIGTDPIVIS